MATPYYPSVARSVHTPSPAPGLGGGASLSGLASKDRTGEFRSLVSGYVSQHGIQPKVKKPSAAPGPSTAQNGSSSTGASPKSEFARRAHSIGLEITQTTTKLGRLAQLARRKTLLDDRPVEISELTYIIKHDIAAINRQLAELQTFAKQQKGGGAGAGAGKGKLEEHRGNVVTLLQTKLAGATNSFQDILEVRTQNMKASRDRSEQFAYNAGAAGMPNVENSDSPLYLPSRTGSAAAARGAPPAGYDGYDPKGKGKAKGGAALPGSGAPAGMFTGYDAASGADAATGAAGGGQEFLALEMGNGPPGGADAYMQMQLMDGGEQSYMQQRSTAIESIESTISELGQIFGQLANMVAEQRETVQRIDDDVFDVADNVGAAQKELLKFYNSVASNRWLMFKIFGVLIIFFLLFILVS